MDLETIKAFEIIREVGLARDCIHNDGVPTVARREQTGRRLIGHDDQSNITPQLLDQLLQEISHFSHDLSSHLKTVRENLIRKVTEL